MSEPLLTVVTLLVDSCCSKHPIKWTFFQRLFTASYIRLIDKPVKLMTARILGIVFLNWPIPAFSCLFLFSSQFKNKLKSLDVVLGDWTLGHVLGGPDISTELCGSKSLALFLILVDGKHIMHIIEDFLSCVDFQISLLSLFCSFQSANTILLQIKVKHYPSRICCWDSNIWSLGHESAPMTTRQVEKHKVALRS